MRRPASAAAPGTRNDILMNIVRKLVILSAAAALAGVAASCSEDAFMEQAPQTGDPRKIEVRIAATATRGADAATTRSLRAEETQNPTVYVGDEAPAATPQTRIAFDENDGTMRWTKGDRIALWGYGSGSAAFENVPFTLWYPREDPSQGLFTGQVNAMAAGTYDYYAACPVPESAAGTKVTYTIPTVQNGRWNPELDIMLAKSRGVELREEILNDVTLRFRHQVHALKITVPEGRNLLGGPIEKLRIEFGLPVAGRMTWDLANPDAAPEGAGAATGITLAFDTPVDEGDSFWVYLAPADLTGVPVRFTATDGTEFSWPLTGTTFRNCTAGTITPVKLTIGELRPQQDFRLTIDPANLGEPVTEIDELAAGEGYAFPTLELSNRTRTFTANADGTFTTRIFCDLPLSQLPTAELTVGSENTTGVYGKHCEVSGLTAEGCTIKAPYLFSEDFSGVTGNDAHADEKGDSAQEMSEAGLPGWTGCRWKTEAGTSVELRSYCGSHTLGTNLRSGRLDSPALACIRNGKQVSLRVSYDIGGATDEKNGVARCTFGWTTQSGPIAGGNGSQNYPENKIDEFDAGTNGTPTYLPEAKTSTLTGCTAATRLTWHIFYRKVSGTFITNKSFYFYMDNVRVTIAH